MLSQHGTTLSVSKKNEPCPCTYCQYSIQSTNNLSPNVIFIVLSLDPVIGAITAGNAVVLKPSEIAPATSSLLANLLQEYVDNTSVKVIEGAADETSALLEQKWDKIFYTGFCPLFVFTPFFLLIS